MEFKSLAQAKGKDCVWSKVPNLSLNFVQIHQFSEVNFSAVQNSTSQAALTCLSAMLRTLHSSVAVFPAATTTLGHSWSLLNFPHILEIVVYPVRSLATLPLLSLTTQGLFLKEDS